MNNSADKHGHEETNEYLLKRASELAGLIQNANSIILRMDVYGNITYLNEFGQKFFGYREAEIVGKNVVGTIVPSTDNSGQDLKVMIDDIMVHPQKYINNENENILRSGQRVWVSWTNKPILGKDKLLKEVLSIGNDITRLKQIETELSKAKELAESANKAGVVVCDARWKIKSMNPAARKYFSTIDPFGKDGDFLQVMLKDYSSSISKDEIANLANARKTFDLVRPEKENKKALCLQASMEAVKNQLHEIASIVITLQDVTYNRYQETTKGDSLDTISHKLQNPIAQIQDAIDLCKMPEIAGPLSQKQREFLDVADKECKKLTEMVDKLLKIIELSPK